MANDILRAPDERSGPAIAGREPIILPEQRKKAASTLKDRLNL